MLKTSSRSSHTKSLHGWEGGAHEVSPGAEELLLATGRRVSVLQAFSLMRGYPPVADAPIPVNIKAVLSWFSGHMKLRRTHCWGPGEKL